MFYFDRRPRDIDTFISHLSFKIDRTAADTTYSKAFWERRFKAAFERYLRGIGHPDHPDVRNLLGEEFYQQSVGDHLLRPTLLLQGMLARDLLPPEDDWKLEVSTPHFVFGSISLTVRAPVQLCAYAPSTNRES